MKTAGNFAELKRPELAVKLFVRFVLAKAVVTYGLELMMALFTIVQGIISTMMSRSGFGAVDGMSLPDTITQAIEDVGFWQSIPLWVVSLLGSLFITVLSFIMILSVYGRFFSDLSVYSDCSGSARLIRWRAEPEYRQIIFERICSRLYGRGDHRAGVHHLRGVCQRAPGCRSWLWRGHDGMDVHRRTHFLTCWSWSAR